MQVGTYGNIKINNMSKIIEDFYKATRIKEIIDSCETKHQLDNCEKWIYQLNIDNEYKSHFIKLLAVKSKQL